MEDLAAGFSSVNLRVLCGYSVLSLDHFAAA